MDKELKARLQHAVIGEGSTTTSSIPKKGEIIFNDTLDNLKVGNGNTTYSQLNNFIKTIAAAAGSDIGDVGTPSVTTSTSGDTTTFTFHQLKGEQGTLWSQGTAVTTTTSSIPAGINVGDYYLNTSTLDVWKCVSTTASTKWSLVCNIRGSKWFYGSASPATVSGSKSGDMYLNTSDGGVWIRSDGSPESWQYIANITGPQGLNGVGFYYINDSPSSSAVSLYKPDIIVPTGRTLLPSDLILALNGNVFRVTSVTDTLWCDVTYITCLKGDTGDIPIATSGVNGKLIVDSNASSRIPLYRNTTHNHVGVPIYYAEHAGSGAGPARHYINVYDIANAIASNSNLKEWFKEILK